MSKNATPKVSPTRKYSGFPSLPRNLSGLLTTAPHSAFHNPHFSTPSGAFRQPPEENRPFRQLRNTYFLFLFYCKSLFGNYEWGGIKIRKSMELMPFQNFLF
jgi:hypothetical protein